MVAQKHGSRIRYQSGCRCVACCRSNYRRADRPEDLRWPLRFLTKKWDLELISDRLELLRDPMGLVFYRKNGLSDIEADHVAIGLGEHPMMIWPGWIEAGTDYEE